MKKKVIPFIFIVLMLIVYLVVKYVSNNMPSLQTNNIDKNYITKLEVPPHVKNYNWTIDKGIIIKEVFIPVNPVMQRPELPQGCEIVALTAVLNTYGYNVTKTELADTYLPKTPFSYKNGKLIGPNPYVTYAGNPRSEKGFFTYAPPIIDAAKHYLNNVKGNEQPLDISGSKKEDIIDFLNKGIPVVIWVTLDLGKPKLNYSWYIEDTDEKFIAPVNSHTVVLNGYDEKNVYAMNPLEGQMTYNIDTFFNSYLELGSHAMVVDKNI